MKELNIKITALSDKEKEIFLEDFKDWKMWKKLYRVEDIDNKNSIIVNPRCSISETISVMKKKRDEL